MDYFVLIYLYIWTTWVVTDNWDEFQIYPLKIYLLRKMLSLSHALLCSYRRRRNKAYRGQTNGTNIGVTHLVITIWLVAPLLWFPPLLPVWIICDIQVCGLPND